MGDLLWLLLFIGIIGGVFGAITVLIVYFEAKHDFSLKFIGYDNKYGPILGFVYELGYQAGESATPKLSNLSKNKTRFNR
jgi:H+/Cl- antiporter ClcA